MRKPADDSNDFRVSVTRMLTGEISRVGVSNHLLIADASPAGAVLASEEPSQSWNGFFCQGLDRIKLATLWALIETGSADDRLEQRLDAIQTIERRDKGPWVDVIPPEMLQSLASIAAMEE